MNTNHHTDRRFRHVWALLLLVAVAMTSAVPVFAADTKVVNVNQAERTQLMYLPRVGPALADRIITFREENGPFKKPDDLILVRGIGDKTFALMAEHVVVEGATTLTEKLRPSQPSDAP